MEELLELRTLLMGGQISDALLLVEKMTEMSKDDKLIDTLRSKDTEILGSTKPLNSDSLRSLNQRWDSPQATLGRPYPSCMAASSFLRLKLKPQNPERLVPVNLLPITRRKLEQCNRTR